MSLLEIVFIGIGLAMDSFATSIGKGLACRERGMRIPFLCGLYFGFFQGFMPVVGFYLGHGFRDIISSIDHWIAFILLSYIGISMILDSKKDDEEANDRTDVRTMLILAIATSIDALMVGVTASFLYDNIWLLAVIVFAITAVLSFIGVYIGRAFGLRYRTPATVVGGSILILLGIKILLEHLGIIEMF